MTVQLALKVDVDTLRGYREGVPRMLDLFQRYNIKASIFFSMGPDNSGKAIRRVFRKGFLQKMFRTNAAGTYGLKTMLYGTILPAPQIAASDPDIIRTAVRQGHDCGVHCYDHVTWQDELDSLQLEQIKLEFDKAYHLFEVCAGNQAYACAAPAWKVNQDSFAVQDQYDLLYCSDTRGRAPFIPKIGERAFKTVQIPTTLPTMDEIYGADGIDDNNINEYYLAKMTNGLNVHTIHAEMEGMGKLHVLEDFIVKSIKKGVTFVTLKDIADTIDMSSLPVCEVEQGIIPGRAGKVALQGSTVS